MSEWIEELIGKRGKVRVLDIGCGAGRFLNDLKEKFGDDVQAYGVSALRYGEYGPLEEKGIKIAIGDAQALISLLDKAGLPQEGYDVVTSVFSMMYFADELATFKQAYNILSEGGMGFFHGIGFGFSENYIKREMGLEQSSSVRIFVKNRPRLTLPDLRYSLLFKLGEQTPESICYTVDSEYV